MTSEEKNVKTRNLRILRFSLVGMICIGLLSAVWITRVESVQSAQYTWLAVASGLEKPTDMVMSPDNSGRFFVLEQPGQVRIVQNGNLLPTPFVDVRNRLTSRANEQGLLGIAFPPDFAQTRRVYLAYTNPKGEPTLARVTAQPSNPNLAEPNSLKELLSVPHPFANHNGGQLAFGADGYLYWGQGDGGAGGDPYDNGQNLNTLLGAILRLDVSGDVYAIPETNPYRNRPDARPELWAVGLRNPWRFSFDLKTNDLYIADVGQNMYEEINFQPANSKGGENYGWAVYEASKEFKSDGGAANRFVFPIAEYAHGNQNGCSVTGGHVYRGTALPGLVGQYIYGDYCSGRVWQLGQESNGKWVNRVLMDTKLNITTFGQDSSGELYLADRNSGTLYKLVKK